MENKITLKSPTTKEFKKYGMKINIYIFFSYDRLPYPTGAMPPASLSVKLLNQPGTSPPTAASAPLNTSRSHSNYNISPGPVGIQHQVQTQPLDLGVSSNKSK